LCSFYQIFVLFTAKRLRKDKSNGALKKAKAVKLKGGMCSINYPWKISHFGLSKSHVWAAPLTVYISQDVQSAYSTFLGTNSLFLLMCREAVNQSIKLILLLVTLIYC